jgi:hypothetical protein
LGEPIASAASRLASWLAAQPESRSVTISAYLPTLSSVGDAARAMHGAVGGITEELPMAVARRQSRFNRANGEKQGD